MSEFTGIVSPSLQIGSAFISNKPVRGIFNIKFNDGSTMDDIIPQIVEEERLIDQMEITQHPVEQGASIADHAFKRPAEVTVKFSWSKSFFNNGINTSLVNAGIGLNVATNPNLTGIANIAAIGINAVTGQEIQSQFTGSSSSQNDAIYQALLQLQANRGLFSLYTGKRILDNMLLKTIALEVNRMKENSLHAILTCEQLIIVQSEIITLPANVQFNPSITASPVNKGNKSPIAK